MYRTSISLMGFALIVLGSAAAWGQQPTGAPANPAPGCTATPAQLDANKKVAMSFFTASSPDERVALVDPSYKQHNPQFVKRAADDGVSDYEEFKKAFGAARGGAGGGRRGGPGGPGAGPRPPQGDPFEVVTAECDIVTIIHKNYRQDPTADPGKFYEVFTFDTFRIRDGKLVEHWDGAVINPPGTGAPGGAPAAPAPGGRAQ